MYKSRSNTHTRKISCCARNCAAVQVLVWRCIYIMGARTPLRLLSNHVAHWRRWCRQHIYRVSPWESISSSWSCMCAGEKSNRWFMLACVPVFDDDDVDEARARARESRYIERKSILYIYNMLHLMYPLYIYTREERKGPATKSVCCSCQSNYRAC